MNTPSEPRSNPQLTSYQAEFVRQFTNEVQPGSSHLLVAPVGTGKSFAIAAAMAELLKTDRVVRALIVAPAALAPQWSHLLSRWGVEALVLNAQMLRLLKERGNKPDAWPARVFAISINLAGRSDVQEFLTTGLWDLIVVDEAHRMSARRSEVVRSLLQGTPPAALLLATSDNTTEAHVLERAKVIDWSEAVPAYRAQQEAPLLIRRTFSYKRSDEEIALAGHVADCARQLDRTRAAVLLQRADSSINALEETLVSWVEGDAATNQDGQVAEELLGKVEHLSSDSRLEAFKSLLHQLAEDRLAHVVTFCEYRATLDYLAAAVERDYPAFALHADSTLDQRSEMLTRFEAQGGLLITTTAASEGVSLNFVDAAIHFDIPWSAASLGQREGRYHRYGRSAPCTAYVLLDERGTRSQEDLHHGLAQRLDRVGDLGVEAAAFDDETLVEALLSSLT